MMTGGGVSEEGMSLRGKPRGRSLWQKIVDLSLTDVSVLVKGIDDESIEELERARLRLPADVSAERVLLEGRDVAQAIVEEAGRAHELIVLSTHGRTGLRRFLLGSVAERIARLSSVHVVTVPVFSD